jgi:hypothetical protein
MSISKLTNLSPQEAFQLGDYNSPGWNNAYIAFVLIQSGDYSLTNIFTILQNCLLAAAKDFDSWTEFLLATSEFLQAKD